MLAGLWPAGIYKIAASRQRSAALVVGIGVVEVKSDITCPYYPARIIFLQLNTWQEKQVIKKIIVQEAKCIYIDLIVIIYRPTTWITPNRTMQLYMMLGDDSRVLAHNSLTVLPRARTVRRLAFHSRGLL